MEGHRLLCQEIKIDILLQDLDPPAKLLARYDPIELCVGQAPEEVEEDSITVRYGVAVRRSPAAFLRSPILEDLPDIDPIICSFTRFITFYI